MNKTLAISVSGHTAQACSGETLNAQNVYGASSRPDSGIKPEKLAEVHQGASVFNILTPDDCKKCKARDKCDELKAGTLWNIQLGNDNCLTLREGMKGNSSID